MRRTIAWLAASLAAAALACEPGEERPDAGPHLASASAALLPSLGADGLPCVPPHGCRDLDRSGQKVWLVLVKGTDCNSWDDVSLTEKTGLLDALTSAADWWSDGGRPSAAGGCVALNVDSKLRTVEVSVSNPLAEVADTWLGLAAEAFYNKLKAENPSPCTGTATFNPAAPWSNVKSVMAACAPSGRGLVVFAARDCGATAQFDGMSFKRTGQKAMSFIGSWAAGVAQLSDVAADEKVVLLQHVLGHLLGAPEENWSPTGTCDCSVPAGCAGLPAGCPSVGPLVLCTGDPETKSVMSGGSLIVSPFTDTMGYARCRMGWIETCENDDDDCDGEVDEAGAVGCTTFYYDYDHDQHGAPSSPSKCLCQPDEATKYTGEDQTDCRDDDPTVYPEAPEICDDKDNDCDGTKDEDPPATEINRVKLFQDLDHDGFGGDVSRFYCTQTTFPACDNADSTDCWRKDGGDCWDSPGNKPAGGAYKGCAKAASVNPGVADTCGDSCNADCDNKGSDGPDGNTEACICEYGKATPCDIYTSYGKCSGARACKENGQLGPCMPDTQDCEELTHASCETAPNAVCDGVGECAEAEKLCVGGKWAACRYKKSDEVCDGKDNDCDGMTDEDLGSKQCCVCTGSSCVLTMIDTCESGVMIQKCEASKRPGVQTKGEQCDDANHSNSLDEDCDGVTDEYCKCQCKVTCTCDSNGKCTKTCAPVTASRSCGKTGNGCVGGTQKCTCSCGGATCANNDQWVGSWSGCTGDDVKMPSPERCDGIDNDCNGFIDDLGDLSCGVGKCSYTTPFCLLGATQTCLKGLGATNEVCNDRDDNCDGEIDEGCDKDGDLYCDAVFGFVDFSGSCPNGTGDCDDADRDANPGQKEICNGKDDDCSGDIDEGFRDVNGNGKAYCVDDDDDSDGVPETVKTADADLLKTPIPNACDATKVKGCTDNCPATANFDQIDSDRDGWGDACSRDDDGDGIPDDGDFSGSDVDRPCTGAFSLAEPCDDNCRVVPNPSQDNVDQDAWGDACDCDMDNDWIPNNNPRCPHCGGEGEPRCDNCPRWRNTDQADADGGAVVAGAPNLLAEGTVADGADPARFGGGDACDLDDDNDGILDGDGNAPCGAWIPSATCGDGGYVGLTAGCDGKAGCDIAQQAADAGAVSREAHPCGSWGVADCSDNCRTDPNGPPDAKAGAPAYRLAREAMQADHDQDGVGDACDVDDDNDGIVDAFGAASVAGHVWKPVRVWFPDCATGIPGGPDDAALHAARGNQCSADVLTGCDDNCPWVKNPDQADYDGDGNPVDDDWGGAEGWQPVYAVGYAACADLVTAADDPCDADDDNDGLPDVDEVRCGTNPKGWDSDGDGFSDFLELMPAGWKATAPTLQYLDEFCCGAASHAGRCLVVVGGDAADRHPSLAPCVEGRAGEERIDCLRQLEADLAKEASDRTTAGIPGCENPASAEAGRLFATDPCWRIDNPDQHVPPASATGGGGGCSASACPVPFGPLALALLGLVLRRRRGTATAAAVLVAVLGGNAFASDLQILRPLGVGRGGFNTQTTDTLWKLDTAVQLTWSFLYRPLEIQPTTSANDVTVVEHAQILEFQAGVGLLDGLEVDIHLPVHIHRATSESFATELGGTGVGDLYLGVKYQVLRRTQDVVGLTVTPFLLLGTGSPDKMSGSGNQNFGISLGLDRDLSIVTLALNVGVTRRLDDGFQEDRFGTSLHSSFDYGFLLQVQALPEGLYFFGEISGLVELKRDPANLAQIAAGMRAPLGVLDLSIGYGHGFTRALASPAHLVFVGLGYYRWPEADARFRKDEPADTSN
jgi:hypothetical protein